MKIKKITEHFTKINKNHSFLIYNTPITLILSISFISTFLFFIYKNTILEIFHFSKKPLIKRNLESSSDDDEHETYIQNTTNPLYATLTPVNGFDYILINLGGITEVATRHFNLFLNSSISYVPKRTKIICLAGPPRVMQFMIDHSNYTLPVPAWFNVDAVGRLVYNGTDPFVEARESKNYILDQIDEIVKEVNGDYKKLFLSGFSQGGIMTNYVMLNSRHELGGYMPFSGYVLDDHFNPVVVPDTLSEEQKSFLESKKNYYILASHSWKDPTVPYYMIIPGYYVYYKDFPNFKLISFGNLLHVYPQQPSLKFVRVWLKERMGMISSINDL